MKKTLVFLFLALCLSGCSSLKVIPEPQENAVVNTAENSITSTNDGIAMTVKNADVNMYSENLEGTVMAFSIIIDNQTDKEVTFTPDSFRLLDGENRQYSPLTPEKVKEILSRDTYYLIPYPYVGFYYLEDYEKSAFYNRFNTKEPYFYEMYPQDIFTKALPAGSIIPKAKVAGLLYFRIDLNDHKLVKLLAYRDAAAKAAPDFTFPFRISK